MRQKSKIYHPQNYIRAKINPSKADNLAINLYYYSDYSKNSNVYCPKIWNFLPYRLKNSTNSEVFKTIVKIGIEFRVVIQHALFNIEQLLLFFKYSKIFYR